MHVPSELASKIEDITFATAKKIDLDLNTTKFYLNKRKLFIENERELQKCKKCRSKECGLLKRNKEIEVLKSIESLFQGIRNKRVSLRRHL